MRIHLKLGRKYYADILFKQPSELMYNQLMLSVCTRFTGKITRYFLDWAS
jgi:hypothetical protein